MALITPPNIDSSKTAKHNLYPSALKIPDGKNWSNHFSKPHHCWVGIVVQ